MNPFRKLWAHFRVRLIATFAAIALITYLWSGLFIYNTLASEFPEIRRGDLEQKTEEIRLTMESGLRDNVSLDRLGSELSPLQSAGYEILIVDNNGRIITASPIFLNQNNQLFLDERQRSGSLTLADDQRYVVQTTPLRQDGRVVGHLTVAASLEAVDLVLQNLLRQLYPSLILSLVAIAGAGVFISRNISRVLNDIGKAAIRVARGEFDLRIQVASSDEIGRLAQTINEMAAELALLSHTRAQFLSKVSHELRTPLTIIKGFAITLIRRDDLDPQMARQIRIIDQQTDSLVRLVDDLLDLARLNVNQLEQVREPVDLRQLSQEVYEAHLVLAQARQIVLELNEDNGALQVEADPVRIKQILGCLLDNALKYTAASDQVIVRLGRTENKALIRVEDDGPGIPDANLPYVFEQFYQVDPERDGMGLGLAVARELAQAHGGDIKVTNRVGGGCAFSVTLPLIEATAYQLEEEDNPLLVGEASP